MPQHIGYVPQRWHIDAKFPLTVRDLFAIALQRRPLFLGVSARTRQIMDDLLQRVWAPPEIKDRLVEKLSPGQANWTDEQSRKNFEVVSKLVNPGDPGTSRLLLHPLAPEGGGDVFHSGGRQFADRNDPGWKTIADWVNGATTGK